MYSAGQPGWLGVLEVSSTLLHDLKSLLQLIGRLMLSWSLLYHNFTTQTSLVQKSRPENSDVCSNRSGCNDCSGSSLPWLATRVWLLASGFIFATRRFLSTPQRGPMLLNRHSHSETSGEIRAIYQFGSAERTLPLGGFGSGKVGFPPPEPPLVNSATRCSNSSAKSFCSDRS